MRPGKSRAKKKKSTAGKVARRKAIVKSPPADKAGKLAQRVERVLQEIARHVARAEGSLQSIATYLVKTVFRGDWRQALEAPFKNELWVELRSQVPTAQVRLSQDQLGRALRIGAWDACIGHKKWTGLPFSFKATLLPLNDRDELLKAAIHVVDHGLARDGVIEYLATHHKPNTRGPTPGVVLRQAERLSLLGDPRVKAAFVERAQALDDERREALREELESAAQALREIADELG